jgi:DNA-binding IclR family transcriptional regulator
VQAERGAPYRLGPRLLEISQAWAGRQDRAELAAEEVAACCSELKENIVLAEIQGGVLVPLAQSAADGELTVRQAFPERDTIHLRANGRILLAALDATAWKDLLDQADFSKGGARAPKRAADLSPELSRIRRTGIACTRDVAADGISALAVGITDRSGHIEAALGCNLPTARLNKERERYLAKGLQRTAERIASAWGWR